MTRGKCEATPPGEVADLRVGEGKKVDGTGMRQVRTGRTFWWSAGDGDGGQWQQESPTFFFFLVLISLSARLAMADGRACLPYSGGR